MPFFGTLVYRTYFSFVSLKFFFSFRFGFDGSLEIDLGYQPKPIHKMSINMKSLFSNNNNPSLANASGLIVLELGIQNQIQDINLL